MGRRPCVSQLAGMRRSLRVVVLQPGTREQNNASSDLFLAEALTFFGDAADEAWEIAERSSMKLYMADIHLYRVRLFFFFHEQQCPWQSPRDDLAAAEKLINDCGYHRRDEELADAKQAILG